MPVVFMGTPDFSVPSLRALVASGFQVLAVVTQPDRPRGRGQRLTPSPVKAAALALGLPVWQPEKLSEPGVLEALREIGPEAVVVVAFGQKVPPEVLHLPPLGCVNVHASLLPRFRGAAPIQRAILAGESETGVTTMLMDEGWDTGPMLLQERVPLRPDETGGSLHDRLAEVGARLLVETLRGLRSGAVRPIPQDDRLATVAPRLKEDELLLEWTETAESLERKVRALAPLPGAVTFHRGRRLIVEAARVAGEDEVQALPGEPGTLCTPARPGHLLVSALDLPLEILRLRPAGSRSMEGRAYLNGFPAEPGDRLGPET
ncbi:methionyl-tRNA formyltransferase [Limnochorda pilosa]|uniref:Methionyl-tRNA formyltransferase n=2 Tax=Limnochorda pilosa TaxID=1555112 RepID=A0A0K2SK93_LIMPI|nr:methionyl-tRNA formyltransferase [Limnochorda pilosa]